MKKRIVLIVLIFVLVLSVIFLFMKPFTTGKAVSSLNEPVPRHIFYHMPQAESNYDYLKTCYPAHEIMPVIPDAKCCSGLIQLTVYDESEPGCSIPLFGVSLCSDCGNYLCEYGENECNCPIDCNKPEKRL